MRDDREYTRTTQKFGAGAGVQAWPKRKRDTRYRYGNGQWQWQWLWLWLWLSQSASAVVPGAKRRLKQKSLEKAVSVYTSPFRLSFSFFVSFRAPAVTVFCFSLSFYFTTPKGDITYSSRVFFR